MSLLDDLQRRAARNRSQAAANTNRLLTPRIAQGPTSQMTMPNQRGQQRGRPEPRGPRGYRQMGDETLGIMESRPQQIRDAAAKKSALQRAGAEKGIAGAVGRSARQAGAGGRTEMLAQTGSDLSRDAAATAAGAELAATDALLEAREFEAEKYVSPTEARSLVENYIDSIEADYKGLFGDDEDGLADDIERWANEKGADGKPLRSQNERKYAMDQAARLRKYEQNYFGSLFGSGGGRKIGYF